MWSRALLLTVLSLGLLAAGCKTDAAKHKAAGNMLFNQGEYAQARDEYAQAVKSAPDDPGARTLLGNALLELGEYPAARAEYEAALEADPTSPEAHRGVMTVIAHTAKPGDRAAFQEFLGHAEAIISARPKDKNAIITAAAVLSEAANPEDPEAYRAAQSQAESYLRRGLAIDDRDPKLLFHLALVYARLGQVDVAERVVERIAKVEPQAGFADYTAAIVYTIGGQRDQALARVESLLAQASIPPESLLAPSSYLEPLHDDARFAALVEAAKARAD